MRFSFTIEDYIEAHDKSEGGDREAFEAIRQEISDGLKAMPRVLVHMLRISFARNNIWPKGEDKFPHYDARNPNATYRDRFPEWFK